MNTHHHTGIITIRFSLMADTDNAGDTDDNVTIGNFIITGTATGAVQPRTITLSGVPATIYEGGTAAVNANTSITGTVPGAVT